MDSSNSRAVLLLPSCCMTLCTYCLIHLDDTVSMMMTTTCVFLFLRKLEKLVTEFMAYSPPIEILLVRVSCTVFSFAFGVVSYLVSMYARAVLLL